MLLNIVIFIMKNLVFIQVAIFSNIKLLKIVIKLLFRYVNGLYDYTYKQINEKSIQLAHTFVKLGYGSSSSLHSKTSLHNRNGSHICIAGLLMENCPMFIITWFALSKLGITVSLLNTSLRGRQLLHAVNVAKCTFLIISTKFQSTIDQAKSDFQSGQFTMNIPFPNIFYSNASVIELSPPVISSKGDKGCS